MVIGYWLLFIGYWLLRTDGRTNGRTVHCRSITSPLQRISGPVRSTTGPYGCLGFFKLPVHLRSISKPIFGQPPQAHFHTHCSACPGRLVKVLVSKIECPLKLRFAYCCGYCLPNLGCALVGWVPVIEDSLDSI